MTARLTEVFTRAAGDLPARVLPFRCSADDRDYRPVNGWLFVILVEVGLVTAGPLILTRGVRDLRAAQRSVELPGGQEPLAVLGAYMMMATPIRQMLAPVMSHRSGRNLSTSMPQARDPATKTPP